MAASRLLALSRVTKRVGLVIFFAVLVVVSLLYLTGTFQSKVALGTIVAAQTPTPMNTAEIQTVRTITVPRIESAVGTIRPVHEAQIEAKIMAKVVQINVTAGQKVRRGQVLVRLDDADLTAKLQQAQAALSGARAAHRQAVIELKRIRKLMAADAATQLELDRYTTDELTTRANVQQQVEAVSEAKTVLSYATIRSPMNGRVIDKQVNVGDTAAPGKVLLTMYDPTHMQLIASVRESLAQRLKIGQTVNVWVESLAKTCHGTIREIVPQAHVGSRTFSVKVTGPCDMGTYTGMFGRLLIPLGSQQVLVIPRRAVTEVGQLNIVKVARNHALWRRAVMLGRRYHHGQLVQVLSGLRAGERVYVPQPSAGTPGAITAAP